MSDSDKFWDKKNISNIRGKLHHLLKNPILDQNDLVLFTGEDNDQVVSYLSICPELIKLNGHPSKIYWLNSWWVDPSFQNTGIAGFIFFKAWNLLEKNIAVSSFSGSAEQFYNRIGKFDVLKDKYRHSIFLNIDTNLILLKFSFLRPIKILLNLMRIPLNACYFCLTLTLNHLLRKNHFEIQYVDNFDNDLWSFVKDKTEDDLVLKSKEYFNWKISNHISYKVVQSGNIVGFLSFSNIIKNEKSLSNESLKVEYFISESKIDKMIVFLIISLAYKLKCNRIVTESEILSNMLLNYRFFWLFKITQKKNAIISKSYSTSNVLPNRKILHLGDGG